MYEGSTKCKVFGVFMQKTGLNDVFWNQLMTGKIPVLLYKCL